jgi:hypothetical protein
MCYLRTLPFAELIEHLCWKMNVSYVVLVEWYCQVIQNYTDKTLDRWRSCVTNCTKHKTYWEAYSWSVNQEFLRLLGNPSICYHNVFTDGLLLVFCTVWCLLYWRFGGNKTPLLLLSGRMNNLGGCRSLLQRYLKVRYSLPNPNLCA